MARYFAEIDDANLVKRVVVADSIEWCVEHLGGTWVEAADPYSAEPQERTYPGRGWGHDPEWPQRFAPRWTPRGASDQPYSPDELAFHNGRIWRAEDVTRSEPAPQVPDWAPPSPL